VLLTREAARGSVGSLLSGALATRLALFLPVAVVVCLGASRIGVGAASPASIQIGIAWAAAGIVYGCVSPVLRTTPRRLLAIMSIETLGVGGRFVGALVLIARGATIPALLGLAAALQVAQAVAAFAVWRIIAPYDRLARPTFRSAWTMLSRAFPFALTGLVANAQARMAPLMLGYLSTAGETASPCNARTAPRISTRSGTLRSRRPRRGSPT
jgi:hypothetical protein